MKDEIKKGKKKIKREEERERKQQKAHFAGRAVEFIPGWCGMYRDSEIYTEN